jgi:hypothetical protein
MDHNMKKRLTAAIVAGASVVLSGVAIVATPGVASAEQHVTVCNRYVGDRCVETVTCTYDNRGNYICSDGSMGGPDIHDQPRV